MNSQNTNTELLISVIVVEIYKMGISVQLQSCKHLNQDGMGA